MEGISNRSGCDDDMMMLMVNDPLPLNPQTAFTSESVEIHSEEEVKIDFCQIQPTVDHLLNKSINHVGVQQSSFAFRNPIATAEDGWVPIQSCGRIRGCWCLELIGKSGRTFCRSLISHYKEHLVCETETQNGVVWPD